MGGGPFDALVVGAGPVGTALALDLARRGRSVRVLEARPGRPSGSRAIGVHPPGLAYLAELGLADALVAAGCAVRSARAVGARRPLGHLDLGALPPPYPFVLAVPQAATERLLAEALARVDPHAVERGSRVERLEQDDLGVTLWGTGADGAERRWRAGFVVGCDGRDGTVRTALGVARRGGPYPDRFAMADLLDDGAHLARDEALIALHPHGVVEGFPLPGGVRRWVVRVGPDAAAPGPAVVPPWVAERVAVRTGHRPGIHAGATGTCFGVERWLAARFAVGRVALAGDAAHVLSPIGGQGMNLGWLDAAAWAEAIDLACAAAWSSAAERAWAAVGARRRRAARRAIARAAMNTALGRAASPAASLARDLVVAGMLRPPWVGAMRRRFTMGGLA